jgi:hypothetical protein
MWDTTALNLKVFSSTGGTFKIRGIPYLAKNERDMGYPALVADEDYDQPSLRCR